MRIYCLFLLSIFFLSDCRQRAASDFALESTAGTFKLDALDAQLKTGRPSNLTNFLTSLKANAVFSSLFANAVIVPYSRSEERGDISLEHPRVVLYGQDFFMAYTTKPNNPFEDHLQVIEYVPGTGEYQFAEVKPDNGSLTLDRAPTTCMECHGPERMRPIWDDYHFWPSAIDALHEFGQTMRGGAAIYDFRATEYFLNYNRRGGTEPRLGLIAPLRYFALPATQPSMPPDPEGWTFSDPGGPSRRLGDYLGLTVNQAVAFHLNRVFSSNKTTFRYAIAGALAGCKDYETFFPPEVLADANIVQHRLGTLSDDIRASVLADFRRRRDFAVARIDILPLAAKDWLRPRELTDELSLRDSDLEPRLLTALASLRFLTENHFVPEAFNLRDFSLSRRAGGYSYAFQETGQSQENRAKIFASLLRQNFEVMGILQFSKDPFDDTWRERYNLLSRSQYPSEERDHPYYWLPSGHCETWKNQSVPLISNFLSRATKSN